MAEDLFENKTLKLEVEAEVERELAILQYNYVSPVSDLQESTVEVSNLKRDLEEVKEREKEKDVALETVTKERDLLLAKVTKLEEVENSLRRDAEGKEKEIRTLKTNLEAMEVVLGFNKALEKNVKKLKGKISFLKSSLDEKQKVISEFETEGKTKGLKEKKWVLAGGSTIAAVAVVGVVCYVNAAKQT